MSQKIVDLLLVGKFGIEAGEKFSKPQRVFNRGVKLSFVLYLCTAAFFIFWVLGQSRESVLILNSSLFSRVFFFLNPNLFRKVFIEYQGMTLLSGATDQQSFIFLMSYIFSFAIFILILFLSFWLFVISYYTSIRPFHYISCLSLFPVLSFFLITWFIVKLTIFSIDTKLKRASKFQEDFTPEVFEDSVSKSDPLYLSKRPVTEPFTFKQYQDNYKEAKKVNFLKDLYHRLESYLA